MGALHVNGQKATGVNIILADGVFMDVDNEIVPDTTFRDNMSYTATEDCAVVLYLVTVAGASTHVKIDGKIIRSFWKSQMDTTSTNPIFVKKGQVFSVTNANESYDSNYTVYGLQTGTIEGKLQPIIYSTEEREVGVWIDGKPLYQRTLQGTVNVTSTSRNWYTLMPVSALPNLDNVVPIDGSYIIDSGDGQVYPIPMTTGISQGASTSCVYNTSEGLRVCLEGVSAGTSNYSITLQYTKTTDTPGAGTWTPDGAYAHHYSTDEKVIGTWVDGKTIYEKTTAISVTISNADTFYNTDLSANGIDMFIGGTIIDIRNQSFPASVVKMNNDTNIGISIPNGNRDTRFLTYQYTKSSS